MVGKDDIMKSAFNIDDMDNVITTATPSPKRKVGKHSKIYDGIKRVIDKIGGIDDIQELKSLHHILSDNERDLVKMVVIDKESDEETDELIAKKGCGEHMRLLYLYHMMDDYADTLIKKVIDVAGNITNWGYEQIEMPDYLKEFERDYVMNIDEDNVLYGYYDVMKIVDHPCRKIKFTGLYWLNDIFNHNMTNLNLNWIDLGDYGDRDGIIKSIHVKGADVDTLLHYAHFVYVSYRLRQKLLRTDIDFYMEHLRVTSKDDPFYASFSLPYYNNRNFSSSCDLYTLYGYIDMLVRHDLLRTGPELNLNWIDVRNVTNMAYLFSNHTYVHVGCKNFRGDISLWDVRNVNDMSYMFYGSPHKGDISGWQISPDCKMTDMFVESEMPEKNRPKCMRKDMNEGFNIDDIGNAITPVTMRKSAVGKHSKIYSMMCAFIDKLDGIVDPDAFHHFGMNDDEKELVRIVVEDGCDVETREMIGDNMPMLEMLNAYNTMDEYIATIRDKSEELYTKMDYDRQVVLSDRLQKFEDEHMHDIPRGSMFYKYITISDYADGQTTIDWLTRLLHFNQRDISLNWIDPGEWRDVNDILDCMQFSAVTEPNKVLRLASIIYRIQFLETFPTPEDHLFYQEYMQVTSTDDEFYACYCPRTYLFRNLMYEMSDRDAYGRTVNLNWIDVSHIKDMHQLFGRKDDGISLRLTLFDGDISLWDVSNVTDMRHMFYNSAFTGDISEWDIFPTCNVQSMFDKSRIPQNHRPKCMRKNMNEGFDIDDMGIEITPAATKKQKVGKSSKLYGMIVEFIDNNRYHLVTNEGYTRALAVEIYDKAEEDELDLLEMISNEPESFDSDCEKLIDKYYLRDLYDKMSYGIMDEYVRTMLDLAMGEEFEDTDDFTGHVVLPIRLKRFEDRWIKPIKDENDRFYKYYAPDEFNDFLWLAYLIDHNPYEYNLRWIDISQWRDNIYDPKYGVLDGIML